MWKFIQGVNKPPSPKRHKADDYEKKRVRKWNPAWLIDERGNKRDWLHYDSVKNEMSCGNCKKYVLTDVLKKGVFYVGTSNFKKESVTEHERSNGHITATNIACAKDSSAGTSTAAKALSKLNEAQTERLSILFRTVHGLAKHGRPFTDFVWLTE